ncbi:hypothetical protein BCR35DRAFT_324528 [Leucosporidium creatinivorum]|uniref:Uncharacterized protein n=1 Tax=Leucosporidium creatinivorum TaxID=106004 RepID=A0A1Y2FRJ4_9BASI|nr:hypothetical protein BCR35DRAFT_324528 [Leucosporidium creatinivorum]
MAHSEAGSIAAAAVFLAGYSIYFTILTKLFAQRRIKWKSRYLFVYIHVILRLCGMALGVAFSSMSWDNLDQRINVLIAYLVFAAEGYFSLVVCCFRFLIVWQENRFGVSNLEPKITKGTPFLERMRLNFRAPMMGIHYALIGANAIIISGSSILAGSLDSSDPDNTKQKEDKGKALRVAGTAIFLALVQVFAFVAISSYRKKGDRTLLLILGTWPLLSVRGIYGILAVVINAFSYYSASIYTDSGFSTTFVVGEHVLGTLMEWLSCGLLIATHFSALSGGEELHESWGDAEKKDQDGTVVGDGDHLSKRRSSEV